MTTRRSGLLRHAIVCACVALTSALAAVPGAAAASSRAPLATPIGFGRGATGGASGPDRWVTTLADDGPGSLRAALDEGGGSWIRFAVSGTIDPAKPLEVPADTTVDGRDAEILVTGGGLLLAQPNVIIENLSFAPRETGNPNDPQDAVLVRGATRVWIDHCSFTGGGDKMIGVPSGTDISISWNHFHDHHQVVQLGTYETRDASKDIRATLYDNFFERTGYRNPRIAYGLAHAFNNVLVGWTVHGMSAVADGQLLAEANVFQAGSDPNAIIPAREKQWKDDYPGAIRSTGELLLNGATVKQRLPDTVFDARSFYPYSPLAADGSLLASVERSAGAHRPTGGLAAPTTVAPAPPSTHGTTPQTTDTVRTTPATSTTAPNPTTTQSAAAPTTTRAGGADDAMSPTHDEDAHDAALPLAMVAVLLLAALAVALRRRTRRTDHEGADR